MPRRRTPTVVKLATGNPGKRPLPEREPQPAGYPGKPGWLSEDASRIWDDEVGMLVRSGILTAADKWTFAGFCEMAAEVSTIGMAGMSPARITQFRQFAQSLGMDPCSRAKINATPVEAEDPTDKYFAKSAG